MISHKYKCIFIHIPKCAGTSVEYKLEHLDSHNQRGGQDHRSIRMIEQPFLIPKSFSSRENITELLRRGKQKYFSTAKNPKSKYTVTEAQYESYIKFSIVRNPWARVYSWYKNVMRDEIHLKNRGLTQDTTFNEFLTQFAGKDKLRTQMFWLKSFNGSIPMDYIIRFENLQEEIEEIFLRLGLRDTSLPHLLKGAKDDYRKYYDEQTNNIVLNVYKEEIAMFGYRF